MSLLQNPVAALHQVEWYLDNRHLEKFPGAFLISAGNLSRQLLEQILFILAFYSEVPRDKYMKANYQLRTAHQILYSLCETCPGLGGNYLAKARLRGKRIRKFARFPRSLD